MKTENYDSRGAHNAIHSFPATSSLYNFAQWAQWMQADALNFFFRCSSAFFFFEVKVKFTFGAAQKIITIGDGRHRPTPNAIIIYAILITQHNGLNAER